MPSIKSAKSSQAQHPPSNRAFALRMMNSTQNNEGRTSPLNRALKPFKDSFKKSNRGKKAKEKCMQLPSDSLHSDFDQREDDSSDTSYEVLGKTLGRNLLWASQSKKELTEENHKDRSGDYDQRREYDNFTSLDAHRCNPRIHDRQNWMADISEEDEFHFNEDHSERSDRFVENIAFPNNPDSYKTSNHVQTKFGAMNSTSVLKMTESSPKDFKDNNASYFIAPNGEIVKLRRKKEDEETENNIETNSSALRTEKFGKRLSMLCHLLAEKYPEDFHILELLVELQVSNEKREEEMNISVSSLKKKIDSMEYRLAIVEEKSLCGFLKMLTPLAAAAEAFSEGMQCSLSNLQEEGNAKKKRPNVTDECDIGVSKRAPSEEKSNEQIIISENSQMGKKNVVAQSTCNKMQILSQSEHESPGNFIPTECESNEENADTSKSQSWSQSRANERILHSTGRENSNPIVSNASIVVETLKNEGDTGTEIVQKSLVNQNLPNCLASSDCLNEHIQVRRIAEGDIETKEIGNLVNRTGTGNCDAKKEFVNSENNKNEEERNEYDKRPLSSNETSV